VVDSGSTLDVVGALEIGRRGRGHLNASAGGTIASDHAELGVAENSIGTATIQGHGSAWRIAGNLTVGRMGQGEAFVLGGATMSFQHGGIQLGTQPGALGLLTVDGAGSKIDLPAGVLSVGVESLGALTISRGARVTSQSAQLAVGEGQAQVIVGQDDASWTILSTLDVGVADAASLRVDRRALVQAGQGVLGRRSGSLGVLQARGDGARLIFDQGLTVGDNGAGVVEIGSGGSLKIMAGGLILGAEADGEGRVTVGVDSGVLEAESSPTTIGKAGAGFLSVLPQGRLSTGAAQLAVETNSSGVVTVTGRQARWLVHGPLAVGLRGNALLLVAGKGTVEASGDITVGPNGRLCGDGTLKAPFVENHGEVCPGASPGLLTIEGDYQQAPGGRLEIEFAGTTAGETHDLLHVSGTAVLDGTLHMKFIDGFAPTNGQSVTFLRTTNSIVGTFQGVDITGLAPGFQYDLAATRETLSMIARSDAVPTSLPRLKIETQGSNVLLSWFGPSTFQLESNTNLANRLGWTLVTTPPVLEANRHSISVPTPSSPIFFRLRQL
jgi:T5SS/PEP-CTERM-associated repeat protein